MRSQRWLRGLGGLLVVGILTICGSLAAAERVATLTTRGQSLRVLVVEPVGKPRGSVVLLAGGHGRLDIGADGKLGWGAGNQLVRTRAAYAAAGFTAIVPDIAGDMKVGDGVKPRYRWSSEQATDIGAVVRFARGLAAPVHLVATSRAALTAAKAGVQLRSAAERPDTLVITAGMLMTVDPSQPSVEKNVTGLSAITQPVLLLHHTMDACGYTPVRSSGMFKALLTGAKRVDVKLMDGGNPGSGDPCQANSHHGFLGQDADVVRIITTWIAAQ
jgi:hypothetical protein